MPHILAIHAHPDDIETLAAGTLALLAQKGHAVTIATMTAGDCGSITTGPEETARIRRREAAEAAALIGANYVCAGVGDLSVFNDDATRRMTCELIRSARPDLVITGAPADYHPDHEATSALVRDACFAVSVPNYKTGPAKVLDAIPFLYFMDPIGGRDRDGNRIAPEFGIDVSRVFDIKRRMLSCHQSQKGWEQKQHAIDDFTAAMEAWTKKRGHEFGVAHAEGFRQYTAHPYPRGKRLQELLSDVLLLS